MKGGRTDVGGSLQINVSEDREVKIQLNFTNNSPNDYWLASDTIIRNGFKGQFFAIYGGPSEVSCYFHTGQYPGSDLMLVKSGTTAIGPVLLLSNVCSFQDLKTGVYIFKMHQYHILYTNEAYEAHNNGYTLVDPPMEFFLETLTAPIIIGDNTKVINDI